MTLSITALSITALSITTLSIMGLNVTLSINESQYKRHLALQYTAIMLSVIFYFTTLNVILLSVIMLTVTEPQILLHMSTMPWTHAHSSEHFPYQPHDKTSSPATRELHGWSLLV
jgi:hypothetical protein